MTVAVLDMEPITLRCLLLAGSDPAHTSTNRLEIANQGNAHFPQMKTEKNTGFCQLEQFPALFGI